MFPSRVTIVHWFIELSWLLDHGRMEGNPRSTSQIPIASRMIWLKMQTISVVVNSVWSSFIIHFPGPCRSLARLDNQHLTVPGILRSRMVLKCLGLSLCRIPTSKHWCCLLSCWLISQDPEGTRNMAQTSLLEQLFFFLMKRWRSGLVPSAPEGNTRDSAIYQDAGTSLGLSGQINSLTLFYFAIHLFAARSLSRPPFKRWAIHMPVTLNLAGIFLFQGAMKCSEIIKNSLSFLLCIATNIWTNAFSLGQSKTSAVLNR